MKTEIEEITQIQNFKIEDDEDFQFANDASVQFEQNKRE